MTDAEYFKRELGRTYTESGNWQAALRDAESQEQIEYAQVRLNESQTRIFHLCDKLERIKRCQTN